MKDFDLEKTAESGQVFRAYNKDNSKWVFMSRDKRITLDQNEDYESIIRKDPFWREYFDLNRDYEAVRQKAEEFEDRFMISACKAGAGIRMLKQDPWEMLISFIISQRKSIPAIRTSIERLCEKYGRKMDGFYAFPEPEALADADEAGLVACALGYRVEYVRDAARKVAYGEMDLNALYQSDDEELTAALKSVKGVGDKVANCIMLFAYGRTARVPVDVWVKRIIEEDYAGQDPFAKYGEYAGIMQQYAFYYKRNGEQI